MMDFRESGTLPVGVEVDGKVHRDFVLRPRLVRDSVTMMEDSRAQSNEAFRGVMLTACQIEKLGDLKPEQITVDLVLGMFDADLAVIMQKSQALEARLLSFRDEQPNAGAAQAAPGAAEDRGAVAGGA